MKKSLLALAGSMLLTLAFSSGAFAASNTYTVKKGDCLSKIAKTYHISVNQLKQWNHLSTDIVKINQVLTIVAPVATVKAASVSSPKVLKTITVNASAYTMNCTKCSGITATGINLKKNPNAKVISVDPKVIKLGTKVYVPGYGEAVAGDTGGSIKGNKIDIFMPSLKAALAFGRKNITIQIVQ